MRTIITFVLALALLNSCQNTGKKKTEDGKEKSSVALTAAGATFPMPFYNMVFKNYTNETGVQLTYGGIGSGGGIRSLTDKVVDFGATDAYLEDDKLAEMPAEILHIPTCLGAVVIAYNLPGIDELKLSNDLLLGIFMGEITKWNDAAIQSNNPGVSFPDLAITFIHRSDGSGTTHIFSDYMSKISEKWAAQIGTGKSLNWPVGMGAKGNPGVAGTIQQTTGSIGYIGSEYAFAQKIQTAKIQNSSGAYVLPSIESVSAAAQGEIPADTRVMLTNSSDPAAYPISGFTWIIFYKEQAYNDRSLEQAEGTLKFLDWLISEKAQTEASKVNYSPLPAKAVSLSKEILRTATYNGKPVLK
ncbi:MAG: phosphate ABC transporter substrate-binding protein PstS [Bacteroidetes bacterium GWF2_42_66]|nr:MAG: phosphate ABC transporter substrate-binding protein PstS [Bacteroidetes bacterium GWA2_42_15]OFX98465.1 MAG: phosphate ABC transporter substrate-binding protein PstS [Bacteroidetes bacterium GWE2_42_39]OFY42850.1 MAG: phosphate ABC transporter substrate-binding protein PstS [Bacteroidetes bacterium GWF2_42_66]HBL74478.1 phosphate ABC transporter substrate-binding protein PstS [Prolixibacteraceae bacterium]HCR89016.1 phosphate ABC transporter substrate-binding protein PstS [Prolixibacter